MILIVATVRLHPGSSAKYEAAVAATMPRLQEADPGILFYHAGKSRDEPDTYRVIETYADQFAMDRHVAGEGLRGSLAQLMPLIASVDIKLHDAVS